MELGLAVLIVLATLVVGIGIGTVLLMFASGLAASRQLEARQALIIVLVASVVNAVVQGALAVVGVSGFVATGPITLAIWTLIISWVGDLRLGESMITAIAMTVLQVVLGVGLVVALVAAGASMGAFQ